MKMLWYADALFCKIYGSSMTGLVYSYEPMGALPVGHYTMMNLENIKVQEEEGYDSTKYHFYPNESLDRLLLTKEETTVLDSVIAKFENYNAAEIVNYMHEERAYIETNPGEVIPYSKARKIRVF